RPSRRVRRRPPEPRPGLRRPLPRQGRGARARGPAVTGRQEAVVLELAARLPARLSGAGPGDRVRVDHPALDEPARGTVVVGAAYGATALRVRLDGTGAEVDVPESMVTREG